MAPMLSVKYTARDGLVIHGYLTVPVGINRRISLWSCWCTVVPGCVTPGLRSVGAVAGQPRLRGVADELSRLDRLRGRAYRKARRQIGHEIQDDIEDATRWAITAGVADPKHIAIMGGSYGGYSTLFAWAARPSSTAAASPSPA